MAFLSDEDMQNAVEIYRAHGNNATRAAISMGLSRPALEYRLQRAALKGLLGTKPVLPGFKITKTTAVTDQDGEVVREFITQKPEAGEEYAVPNGHRVKGVSAYVGGDGRTIAQWIKTREDEFDQVAAVREAVRGLKDGIPKVKPTKGPKHVNEYLLNQYTVTDLHFGMRAWAEETGGANYDIQIAERLLVDWFSAAVAMAPNAKVGILAQLGDLMHHDSLESVTPTNHNVLDADSRLQKIIRVVIRVVRQIISMMLQRHELVHVIMASANHDPASSAWMRELLHALYENEPRITIDNSPDVYYVYEWGKTALFYHHGHKRKIANVDSVFAGKFREIYGRCPKAYGHIGHLHSDEWRDSNLMKVERHRTLAPADAYASSSGWLSERDAKVITYHREFGEVSRIILSPQMVTTGEAA